LAFLCKDRHLYRIKALEIITNAMILNQQQIDELGIILKEEMGVVLASPDLSLLGNSVVKYFEILAEVNREVQNEKENPKPITTKA